jgi:molybdopterin-binding protein
MLEARNISYSVGDFALNNVSFTIHEGDYFTVLGESGAGKSMLLETIAGLVRPSQGTLWLDGEEITSKKIQDRRIGLVFQDHAVFPHMSAYENIAYSLHGKKITQDEKKEKILHIAKLLSISELLQRRPSTLSGGELQRVALARTLIQEPRILLLDEPLASIDSRIKSELRSLLRSIHRKGQTILHVTHDYEEALALATRIAVIHQGQVIQEGAPEDVFQNPKSEFVAHFTGAHNFFKAKITGKANNLAVIKPDVMVTLNQNVDIADGFILIRGEDILLSKEKIESSAANNLQGTILEIIPGIRGIDVTVDAGITFHALITQESLVRMQLKEGMPVWIHFKATAVRFITA